MYFRSLAYAALAGTATSSILWDGRFNDLTSSEDLTEWSFSNEVGPYQYYIHGDGNVTSYVNLDSTFKNPADTGSTQGAKITLDSTSYWEGQTMRRTELIPQTTAAIGAGKVWYHFSLMRSDTNAPSTEREHQIAFFESHFTEMKYGGDLGASLSWDISSTSQWNTTWEADVWHNVAYEIDFDAGTVAFYHSTGADDLTLTVDAVSVSASSNGADWHVGVLELPVDGVTDAVEDVYFSGVYIEDGSLTTSVSGPDGAVVSSVAASVATSSTSALVSSPEVSTASSSSITVAAVATTSQLSSSASAPVSSAPASSAPASSGFPVASANSSAIASVSAVASSTKSKKPCSSVTPTTLSTSKSKKPCSSVIPTTLSSSKSKKPCSSVFPSTSVTAVVDPVVTSAPSVPVVTSAGFVESTYYITETFTVTACAASVTNCPVGQLTSAVRTSKTTVLAITTSSTPVAITDVVAANVASSSVAVVSVSSTKSKKPCASVTPTTLSTAIKTKKPCSSVYPQASASGSIVVSASNSTATGSTIAKYARCGGTGFTGVGTCVSGTTCTKQNDFYYQCV